MKNYIICCIFMAFSSTSFTMLIRPGKKIARQPQSIKTTTLPYIAGILTAVKDPYLSITQKHNIIHDRLARDRDLSFSEENTLKTLLEIIAPTKNTSTLLHSIVKQNNSDLLRTAFHYGLDRYINTQDEHDNAPLYIAAINGFTDMTKILLAAKANVNSKNYSGKTPLIGITSHLYEPYVIEHIASFFNIIQLLIQAGAKTSITDDNNKTALDYVQTILEELETDRPRTVRNENKELINIALDIQKMIRE